MFCGRNVKTSCCPECISSLKLQSSCLKHMSTLNVHTPHTYCPGLHCYYRSKSFTSGKTLAGALNDKDDSKKKKNVLCDFFLPGFKGEAQRIAVPSPVSGQQHCCVWSCLCWLSRLCWRLASSGRDNHGPDTLTRHLLNMEGWIFFFIVRNKNNQGGKVFQISAQCASFKLIR